MQKILTLFAALILCLAFSYRANAQRAETSVILAEDGNVVAYPLSVLSIIDQKCYGCHSPNAKNDKSKEALQWIQLQSMDPVDLLAKLGDMDEVLEEGTMPPEKLLEKYPNMKLTDEETAKLKAWVQNTISRLDD
jgi:uncharacterized membrane protein